MIKLVSGTKAVAAAATPEALVASNLPTQQAWIEGRPTNTQPVFIGDSTAQLFSLSAGEYISLSEFMDSRAEQPINLADIFVKVTVNAEGVNFLYAKPR